MKILITILACFLLNLITHAQEYNYFHYDIKDGLSGITVYSIAQDKDGFIWFGTETGLSRFDGGHFKNYSATDGLADNEIINIFVDSKNRVWIFPFKNAIYYYYQGKIHNAFNDTLLKKFNLKNEIFEASEDKRGNIFFLESDRIHILDKADQLKETDKIDNEDFYNACGISANGNCVLFISSVKDIAKRLIFKYEYVGSVFKLLEVSKNYSFSRNITQVNPGYTLIRDEDSFKIYNQYEHVEFLIKIPQHFYSASYLNDSSLAISCSEKTFLFNINQKKIVDSFLSFKTVNRCFQDNENNLWFATVGHGVYRLSSTQFKIYTFENNSASVPVHTLNMFGNDLLVGANKNILWSLDVTNNISKEIKLKANHDIKHLSVIQKLDAKNFFLGTDDGMFKTNESDVKSYFPGIVIKSLFFYVDSVLGASDRNVFAFSLKDSMHFDTIWHSRATCAIKNNHSYYIGTLAGLYSVPVNNIHEVSELGNSFPVLKNKITALANDNNNELWIGTENFGVACLENNKLKYSITAANGLTSNVCRCLFSNQNDLWIGTDKGVCRINRSTHPFTITNFTAADGLDCEIINCIYARGDSVYVGTPFGVTFFEADKIKNKSICQLKLADIQSGNADWFYKQDSIHLKSDDNFLRFEYAGISFASSGDITYYYQLKGLDTTWISTKQNSVEFQSLPAGDYVFNIYALNKYGVRSKTLSVAFSKAKTFWESLWVQGLIIIIVSSLVWEIFRIRVKTIRKNENEKILRERQMHELEQMVLRSQMNPHFIFNSLNSIQQYVFSGNMLEANQFITSFSSLVRQTLNISAKKFIPLDEEIKYLETYLELEKTKYENIFDFRIRTDENIKPENLFIPPLLLQPYIENSIRHGVLNLKEKRGNILVQFLTSADKLVCIIEDNGIGRQKAIELKNTLETNYQSKGMELVRQRIENLNILYNVSITVSVEDVENNNNVSTQVTIKLPLEYGEQ